jgi:hypothetical protein
VRDYFGKLRGLYAIVERQCKLDWHLHRLDARDNDGDSYQTSIPRREPGTFPEVMAQRAIGVVLQGG